MNWKHNNFLLIDNVMWGLKFKLLIIKAIYKLVLILLEIDFFCQLYFRLYSLLMIIFYYMKKF